MKKTVVTMLGKAIRVMATVLLFIHIVGVNPIQFMDGLALGKMEVISIDKEGKLAPVENEHYGLSFLFNPNFSMVALADEFCAECATNGHCDYGQMPTTPMCQGGSLTNDNGSTAPGSTRTWTCAGLNGGASDSCAYTIPSSAEGRCASNQGECLVGNVINDSGPVNNAGETRTWQCEGYNGGQTTSCSYTVTNSCPARGTPTGEIRCGNNGSQVQVWQMVANGSCGVDYLVQENCSNGCHQGACCGFGVCGTEPGTCDLGNVENDNGSTAPGTTRTWACRPTGGLTATQCSHINPSVPVCGNGTIENGESCDAGAANGQACSAGYGETCSYCSSSCNPITVDGLHCGDGICSSTFENSATCNSDCPIVPVCGDGTVQSQNGEVCDDGNTIDGDGCNQHCQVESTCGDGAVNQASESCDGGAANGQACTPGYGSSCSYCSTSCTTVTVQGPSCGDGAKNGSEQCDDGNTANNDGCSSSCQTETAACGGAATTYSTTSTSFGLASFCAMGIPSPLNPAFPTPSQTSSWTCTLGTSTVTCNATRQTCPVGTHVDISTNTCVADPVCGDGTVNQASEQCDDSNTTLNDGCSSTCQRETPSCSSITVSPTSLTPGDSVTFSASLPQWAVFSGTLDWGDGQQIPAASSLTHSYDSVGSYTISVSLVNGNSSIHTTTCNFTITVTNAPVNGVCNASINGQHFYSGSVPSTSTLCSSGNVTNLTVGASSTTWSCAGQNGGTSQSACSYTLDSCGDSSTQTAAGEQCDAGANNGVACTPGYGGSCSYCSSSCQNTVLSGAFCGDGTTNGSEQCDGNQNLPTHTTCSSQCELMCSDPTALNHGAVGECQYPHAVSGSCGSLDTIVLPWDSVSYTGYTACGTGMLTGLSIPVPGQTDTYYCAGMNGGTGAVCSYSVASKPTCGSAIKTYMANETGYVGEMCGSGSSLSGGADYPATGGSSTWECVSPYGGASTVCTATRLAPVITGQCAQAGLMRLNGITPLTEHSLCMQGTMSGGRIAVAGSTGSYQCLGSNGGGNATCSYIVDPVECGGDIHGTYISAVANVTVRLLLSQGGEVMKVFTPQALSGAYRQPIDYQNPGASNYVPGGQYAIRYELLSSEGDVLAHGDYVSTLGVCTPTGGGFASTEPVVMPQLQTLPLDNHTENPIVDGGGFVGFDVIQPTLDRLIDYIKAKGLFGLSQKHNAPYVLPATGVEI